MEVKEFQKRITGFSDAWAKKRNFVQNEQSAFNHLVEEVGELAMQYVNKVERKDQHDEAEVENAIIDILMQVVKLAHLRGMDIEKSSMKVIQEEQKLLAE